ncbi:hypothetical protein ACLOJK_037884 [Asimina triloba]
MAEKPQPVRVLYCAVCTLPAEYCEYGPDFGKCKPWLVQNAPDLYPDLIKEATEREAAKAADQLQSVGISGSSSSSDAAIPATAAASTVSGIYRNHFHLNSDNRKWDSVCLLFCDLVPGSELGFTSASKLLSLEVSLAAFPLEGSQQSGLPLDLISSQKLLLAYRPFSLLCSSRLLGTIEQDDEHPFQVPRLPLLCLLGVLRGWSGLLPLGLSVSKAFDIGALYVRDPWPVIRKGLVTCAKFQSSNPNLDGQCKNNKRFFDILSEVYLDEFPLILDVLLNSVFLESESNGRFSTYLKFIHLRWPFLLSDYSVRENGKLFSGHVIPEIDFFLPLLSPDLVLLCRKGISALENCITTHKYDKAIGDGYPQRALQICNLENFEGGLAFASHITRFSIRSWVIGLGKEHLGGTSTTKQEEVKRLPGGKIKKKEKQEVVIEKVVRNKRKCVTIVKGLDHFGVKLSDASKKLGKKFATGASVVKGPTEKEQIDVQGDIAYDIVEFITDTWPDVPESAIYFIEDGRKVAAA